MTRHNRKKGLGGKKLRKQFGNTRGGQSGDVLERRKKRHKKYPMQRSLM